MAGRRQNILERIADTTRRRVAATLAERPLEDLRQEALTLAERDEGAFRFEGALREAGMSFICECKKASPSKGLISPDFDPVAIAKSYEEAGAAAVSCLTEPTYFQGADEYLTAIHEAVSIPVLRKDFVVDEAMIYEAQCIRADAVLLICAILTDEQLRDYVRLADELKLTSLVEAYAPEEVPRAIDAGARVIGVNNRDLRTFEVDFGRSVDLRPLVGPDRVFVSESGVETAEDVELLLRAGVDAVLIGETLMRAPDKSAALDELRSLL